MICLSCDKISKSYGTDTVLENVSFSVNDGEKLGIVGVNGAGKSTLIKIISGEITDYSGNYYISRDKRLGYLAQNSEYESDKTVIEAMLDVFDDLIRMENRINELTLRADSGDTDVTNELSRLHERFTSMGGFEFRGRCRGMLISLGFDKDVWEMPVNNLSGGQKTRIALAALLLSDPDIIILDEPTNHLDIDSVKWLEKYLASSKKTIVVISHDRYFLCTVTNKTLEIERCKAKLYNGNYDKYIAQKKRDREIQEHQYKNQQKEISRIEAYIAQQRRWNRERNIIAAESRQKQLDKMERIDAPEADLQSIRMSFTKSEESGYDVLSVRKLSKAYGDKKLFTDLSFELKKQDRMLILGKNGCGKSTLLKILNNYAVQDSGRFEYGFNVTRGYYDQENQNLTESNTVLDELWNSYPDRTQTEIRNALALFLFKGDDIFKQISSLSGGEKARVTFVKLMLSKFNLLILDEPTNHLDIMSREVLEDALLKFDGTIIAVSHDRYFVSKLATRILSLKGSLGAVDYKGTYAEYLDYTEKYEADNNVSADTKERISDAKIKREIAKQEQASKRRNERKIQSAKQEIEAIEGRLTEIDLEQQQNQTDHVKLTELYNEKSMLEERMMELLEFLDENGESI